MNGRGVGKVSDGINEEKLGRKGDKGGTKLERLLHPSIWTLNGSWSCEDRALSEAVSLAGCSWVRRE